MNSRFKRWSRITLAAGIGSAMVFAGQSSQATVPEPSFPQLTSVPTENPDKENSPWSLDLQENVELSKALSSITQSHATNIVLVAEMEGEEFTFGVSTSSSVGGSDLEMAISDQVQRISRSVANSYASSSDPELVELSSTYDSVAAEAKAGDLDLHVSSIEGQGEAPSPTPNQILTLDSADDSLRSTINEPAIEPPVMAAAAAATQWWPTGNATVGNDPYGCYRANGQFVSKCRYFTQYFKWSAARLAKLKSYGSNLTYEPDLHTYNYDNLHYAGAEMSWTSNLPRAYMDTRLDDSANEIAYTVGSADATKLVSAKTYVTHISADWGNATTDKAKVSHQRGYRSPSTCYSTLCVFAKETKTTVPFTAFNVPGSKSWTN